MMKNIHLYAFADEADSRIDGQIEALLRNGLSGIEIRGVDGTNISNISLDKAKEIKKKFDDHGLNVWSIGSAIGKISLDDDFESHLEKFQYTLEIAHILGSKNIRLFSFYLPDAIHFDQYKPLVIDRLSKLMEVAKNTDINLCHENEKGVYGDIPERCLELYRALPELKGIFDPANFVQCGVDTLKAWEMLKPYIHYMHIKDALSNGMVVPAGYGDGNIQVIVDQFLALGGTNFTIEPHLTVFEGLSSLEKPDHKTVISEFAYKDANTAFDTACEAFKKLI